jgi:hypothetical protein
MYTTVLGEAVCFGVQFTPAGMKYDKSKITLLVPATEHLEQFEIEVDNPYPDLVAPYEVEIELDTFRNMRNCERIASWSPRCKMTFELDASIHLSTFQRFQLRQQFGDKNRRSDFILPMLADVDKDGNFFNIRMVQNAPSTKEQSSHSS